MFSDTLLEEDQNARLDPGPPASDAQMAQMGGTQPPIDTQEPPPAPLPGPNAPPDDPAPAPPPPGAPAASQTPAQDLLKQVQGGQITQPAIDKAFGPPPTPPNEPGASAFAPKLGDSPGIDWKGLSDRLAAARGRAGTARTVQTVFANAANPGKYVEDTKAGDDETAGAEDAVKLAQAQQASGIQNSQEADRKAQLERQNKADEWRQLHERMQLTQQAQQAADKLKAEKSSRDMTAEEKAVADQRAEEQLQEGRRAHDLEHGDRLAAIEGRGHVAEARAKAKAGSGAPAPVFHEGELDKVPEAFRPEVASVLRGDAPLRKPSKTDPSAALINHWVYQLKPDYDPSAYERRVKTQEDFTTGKVSQGINALNTAIAHLGELEKSIPDNTNSQLWNKVKNEWLEKTGNPVNRGFDVAKTAVSSELAKAYSAGVATEGEVKGFMDQLNRDASVPQLRETAASFKRFLNGKVAAYQHQWGMGAGHRPIPGGLLSPEAEKSLAGGGDKEGDEKKLSSGTPIVYRNGQWVKK